MVPMEALHCADHGDFRQVDHVLTDVDDTLTTDGRLHGATVDALDRLQRAGIRVIPVTAASAGWCSLMIHMWPIDAVIAENGGLYFHRGLGREISRRDWSIGDDLRRRLDDLSRCLIEAFPGLEMADDASYRETCIAFRRTDTDMDLAVMEKARSLSGHATLNSIWIICWLGDYDKLAMARRLLAEVYGLDARQMKNRIAYVGDSQNDEPMFRFFFNSVGVATVTSHALQYWPRWICRGGGGEGFVEFAEMLIASR